ncbi:MerC domain-containing protein [Sphingomonas sp.]|uniref:MerC domain-containing protein n=1 Tax=Sphingomonas sp. TaxID=28214 RepID=UPI003B3B60BD
MPFAIAALPALATILPVSEHFHLWILAFAAPVAMIALWSGRTRHGATGPLLTGGVGLVLLLLGAIVFGETRWETGLTVAGSLTLALAHIRNWRMRRAVSCDQLEPRPAAMLEA